MLREYKIQPESMFHLRLMLRGGMYVEAQAQGGLPKTFTVMTPSGGEHEVTWTFESLNDVVKRVRAMDEDDDEEDVCERRAGEDDAAYIARLKALAEAVLVEQNALFRQTCVAMGVPVSWFQSKVNARWHVNWRKYGSPTFDLPNTDEVLRFAYDLKMPPYFDDEDFPAFAKVIAYASQVAAGNVE